MTEGRHNTENRYKSNISVRELTIYAALGALMYISFAIMQAVPNIHLVGVFIGASTLTYRYRALIPLYIYVLLYGIFSGFSFWWLPYLYIWLPLWGAFMLAGMLNISRKMQIVLYMIICGFHGLIFGILYAPVQAFFFGLSFKSMLAWIAAGFTFDVIHAVSNFFLATLIIPLTELIKKLNKNP